jgi:hypothetical protein
MIRTNRFAMLAIAALATGLYQQANPEATGGNGGDAGIANAANAAAGTPTASDDTNAANASNESKAETDEQKAARIEGIKAKFNNLVDIKETNFYFRKVTNEVKNPDGSVSKVETKRPTVTIPVPTPSVEGIIAILESGDQKQLDLLLEAVGGVVVEQARDWINEHEEANANNFPYENLSWVKIANLPKAERRGGGISKELWEDFAKDYVEIMPGLTGKKKEAVEMAAKVFQNKFAGAVTNKPVLKLLEGQLAIYAQNTAQGETLTPCIEFLQQKLEKLLNTDETNLLAALA